MATKSEITKMKCPRSGSGDIGSSLKVFACEANYRLLGIRGMSSGHFKVCLTGWAASLVTSTVCLRIFVGSPVWPDLTAGFVSHLIALSVLWLNPRLMPPIGCAVMGVCVGLMLVDMVFDLVIIREGSVRLGPTTVTPGRRSSLRVHGTPAQGARQPRPCLARADRRRACLRMH